jgi:glycosyltransferase involved in cell wall biosynthesis
MIPKVSICIPAYEEHILLRQLLDSIAKQSFNDYEIIIADDSASNEIYNLINNNLDGNIRTKIKYFRNNERKDSPENWNETLRHASGEYIKIMHQDDYFMDANSLFEFVERMELSPNSSLAFSAAFNIAPDNTIINTHEFNTKELKILGKNPNCLFYKDIAIGPPSSVIFKNNMNIFFDNKIKWMVDIDFYIRFLKNNNDFIYIEKPLVGVTGHAKTRVTNLCLNNIDIDAKEKLYLFNKIRDGSLKDYKYFLFIVRLFRKYKIYTQDDLVTLCEKKLYTSTFIKIALFANKLIHKIKD